MAQYYISGLAFKMDFGTLRTLLKKQNIFPSKIVPSGRCAYLFFKTQEEGNEFMTRVDEGLDIKKSKILAKLVQQKARPIPIRTVTLPSNEIVDHKEELLNAVCPLHSIEYQQQIQVKSEKVKDFFVLELKKEKYLDSEAKNRIKDIHFLPARESPILTGYRNKCEFSIGRGISGQINVGFRLSRHCEGVEVMSPEHCPLVSSTMKTLVSEFVNYLLDIPRNSVLADLSLSAYNPVDNSGHWKLLVVRVVGREDPQIMITVVIHRQELGIGQVGVIREDLVRFFRTSTLGIKSVFFAVLDSNCRQFTPDVPSELIMGDQYVVERMCGLEFVISPESFFQVNTLAGELLFESVADLVRKNVENSTNIYLLDLCCGTGTFAIILSTLLSPLKSVGIELCSEAVANARINAQRNNIENIEFIAEDVRKALPVVLNGIDKECVMILDPPRSGVHRSVIAAIRGQEHVTTLIFVSCSLEKASANFVDLLKAKSKRMPGNPFEIKYVLPVDLFPHTRHVEVIVYMTRSCP